MTADDRPRTRTAVVSITAVALLAGAIAVWSNPFAALPLAAEASPMPVPAAKTPASAPPTDAPDSAWTFRTTPDGPEVTVEYELPDGLELAVGEYDGYLAFTSGRTSRGFDSPSTARDTGLRIVDATNARPHFNNDRPLGEDAASFLQGLATNDRVGSPELGPVAAAQLSRVPAWMVDLRGPAGDRVHLDAIGRLGSVGSGLSIDLSSPSRVIVADIESAIILVHVWAGTEADFGGWLAEVEPLVRSLRIVVSHGSAEDRQRRARPRESRLGARPRGPGTVDGREEHAVVIWRTASDDGVTRSDPVSSWLRRTGPGRLPIARSSCDTAVPLPAPLRGRSAWRTFPTRTCEQCGTAVRRSSRTATLLRVLFDRSPGQSESAAMSNGVARAKLSRS